MSDNLLVGDVVAIQIANDGKKLVGIPSNNKRLGITDSGDKYDISTDRFTPEIDSWWEATIQAVPNMGLRGRCILVRRLSRPPTENLERMIAFAYAHNESRYLQEYLVFHPNSESLKLFLAKAIQEQAQESPSIQWTSLDIKIHAYLNEVSVWLVEHLVSNPKDVPYVADKLLEQLKGNHEIAYAQAMRLMELVIRCKAKYL